METNATRVCALLVGLPASGGLPLLLAEHRGAQTSYLVYGPQGTPIYQVTGTGDVMYFHQDGHPPLGGHLV